MNDLVSIITPAFNSADFIEETIISVQNQTYDNWEMLITDDCSTDHTLEIVKKIAEKDSRIKLFELDKNSGSAVARNNSIKQAKGRYHAFLDADDIWFPEKLSTQITEMKNNAVSVSYSSYNFIDERGKNLDKQMHVIEELTYSKLLKNNYIGNLTGMYDAKKIGKIYSPMLRKRQDWCLWLYALKRSEKPALGIQKPLASYRVRSNSISRNKLSLIKYNFLVYRKYLGFNILKSSISMLIFLFEYFFVKKRYIREVLPTSKVD